MNIFFLVQAKTKKTLKKEIKNILDKKGITALQAINLFYIQIRLKKDIPFDIHIPNKTTQKTISDSEKEINGKKFKNTKELFGDLDA